MPLDPAALNAAVLSALGEHGGVIFHVPRGSPPVAVDVPLDAAFRGPWAGGDSFAGRPMDLQDTQLLADTAALDAAGVINGVTVTARGKVWTVVDIQPDDGAMTLLTVKAYAP